MATPPRETLKLYCDYKSPFAYLALEPAFRLEERLREAGLAIAADRGAGTAPLP